MTLYKYTMYVYTKTLNKYELLNFTYPIVFCPVLWYHNCKGKTEVFPDRKIFGEGWSIGKRTHSNFEN